MDYIVTNLRLPTHEYELIRESAYQSGMSINAYIRGLIKEFQSNSLPMKNDSIWDLPKLSKLSKKPLCLSSDDEIIYG